MLVELAIELLRIATIHTPTSLSNAMGMIAAVLLGQFAIDLGIFSEEILLFCAIGDVGGFATPNYELSLTNKYLKIFLIIFVGFLWMDRFCHLSCDLNWLFSIFKTIWGILFISSISF